MAMTKSSPPEPPPDDLDALLPWYETGRLDPAATDKIAAALDRDSDLRRRLGLVTAEREETTALNEALGAPSTRARDRLFARIDAAPHPSRRADLMSRFGAWVGSLGPRPLGWAAAAAATAIVLQAGLLTREVARQGATFETASAPRSGTAADGVAALVGFVPEASAGEIAAFLQANRMSIVDGPRAGGVFRVRIADRGTAPADVEATLARLRAETRLVRFVAPAASE
jgi:hypothetical protein